MQPLKAPFPYLGGKSRIADVVWAALGDVPHYIEPFAGSLAVLLARPHPPHVETVCDADGLIVNVWRAIRDRPGDVAVAAAGPIHEADVYAKAMVLHARERELVERLRADPKYSDPELAGWWCYVAAGTIAHAHLNQRNPGRGSIQLTHPQGVATYWARKPMDADPFAPPAKLEETLKRIAQRIARVRITCADWTRVCSCESVLFRCGRPAAVFLDPPYSPLRRASRLYRVDPQDVQAEVRRWCERWGSDPRLRIVLAGYEGEYDLPGWRTFRWVAQGGFGNQRRNGRNDNRLQETLWLSPSCHDVAE